MVSSGYVPRVLSFLFEFAKEMATLIPVLISVCGGLVLAFVSFGLALAISHRLWLVIPCLITAACVPVLLVIIPQFLYRWRFGLGRRRRAGI